MAQPSTLPPLVRGEWIPMTWEEFLAWFRRDPLPDPEDLLRRSLPMPTGRGSWPSTAPGRR
jgi:hypothetical protein